VSVGKIDRERCAGVFYSGTPVGSFFTERRRVGMNEQAVGPVEERSRFGWEMSRFSRAQLFIKTLQIFENNAPGDTVDGEMMDNDEQPAGVVRSGELHGAEQGTEGQIEAGLDGGEFGFGERVIFATVAGLRLEGSDVSQPTGRRRLETETQSIVMTKNMEEALFENRGVDIVGEFEQHGLVVVMRMRQLIEQSFLDGSERERAGDFALLGSGDGRGRGDLSGETSDGLFGEEQPGSESQALLTGMSDNLDTEDGVAAEFEEVIVDADTREAEDIGPDGSEDMFGGSGRGDISV
jgi:hypothetical protein